MRIFMIIALLLPVGAHALVYRVGSDGACDFAHVADAAFVAALNGPTTDTLLVSKNLGNESASIIVQGNLEIVGGYADCTATTRSGRSVIHNAAGGHEPVLYTLDAMTYSSLLLQDVELSGGDPLDDRGGGVNVSGGYYVEIDNSRIVSNSSGGNGGGVRIDGTGNAVMFLGDGTQIESNTAANNGGGLFCTGGATVQTYGSVSIVGNQAGNLGGGVDLSVDCRFRMHAGGRIDSGIAGNGGSLSVHSGADAELTGDGHAPATISGSQATPGGGGGLFVDGVGSVAHLSDSVVDANLAATLGGGIYVRNGGRVIMERTLAGARCRDEMRCSRLYRNESETNGSALAVTGNATALLSGTYVEDNRSPYYGAPGAVIFANGNARPASGYALRLESNVIAGNNVDSPYSASYGVWLQASDAAILHNTFAQNMSGTGAAGVPTIRVDSIGSRAVAVHGNLFRKNSTPYSATIISVAGSNPALVDNGICNIVWYDDFLAEHSVSVQIIDTLSMDFGTYWPALPGTGGAAVDACAALSGSLALTAPDAHGFPRPYDVPVIINAAGAYDVGAVEWREHPDLIQRNGFEPSP